MKLLEYEAKDILKKYSIPMPSSSLVKRDVSIDVQTPVVLKSQVPTGGRGKSGGIKIVTSNDELSKTVDELFNLDIGGYKPTAILAEELVDIEHELYLSILINREESHIELVASKGGGVDIESEDIGSFYRHSINKDNLDAVTQTIADILEIPEKSFILSDIVDKLLSCFIENDALLIEINPLAITKSGEMLALDCKMELDDTATFRHQDWSFESKPADANFVAIDSSGTIATVANGAGLAMATVDAVKSQGFKPANFLDIGGSATVDSIRQSLNSILELPNVNVIIINIFGGIVKCDTVAEAIVKAMESIPNLPKLLVRLSGTNQELAAKILYENDIRLYDSIDDVLLELKK